MYSSNSHFFFHCFYLFKKLDSGFSRGIGKRVVGGRERGRCEKGEREERRRDGGIEEQKGGLKGLHVRFSSS